MNDMGLGGCGWPTLVKISWTTFVSLALMKSAPSFTSAADAATSLMIAHVIATLMLRKIGSLFLGKLSRKK